jgi:[ribosomal protein S5]-alanine N-acetyltransferase
MNTLRTALCILEPQTEAHAPEMYEALCDPAIYEYEGVPPPSLEKLANGLRRRESRVSPDGKEKWLNWAVRLNSGELAGYVQATIYESGAACVAYEFSSKYWRRGIGTSAVTRMLDDLKDSYAVHTFVAVLKTANFRSMGLLNRLGFEPGSEEDAKLYEALPDETTLVVAAKKVGTRHAA